MSIAKFLEPTNYARVKQEAGLIRDHISWRYSHLPGNHFVSIVVQITDFHALDLAPQMKTGALASDHWIGQNPPASSLIPGGAPFLFANSNIDLGSTVIRDSMLLAYAGYLAKCYLADEKDPVTGRHLERTVRVTFQYSSDDVHWLNYPYDAYWNAQDGKFYMVQPPPVQRT
jgi:hypothetical protein